MNLVQDLKDFLSSPPAALLQALREPIGPRPPCAAAEPTAHARWQLDSLIQDVWEHSHGPESKMQDAILNSLAPVANGKIYDLGAGAGHYAFALAAQGATVMCVERSRVKRMFLRFRIARYRLEKRIFLRRFARTFDTALAINVLDHLRRPHAVIRALAKRTKLSGALAVWAAFPNDGWHTAGPAVRRRFRRSLLKYFQPNPTVPPAPHDLVILTRRRLKPQRIWFDPEITIAPHPQRPSHVVVSAPRAYADGLIATQDLPPLLALCRTTATLPELRALTRQAGFDWKPTRRAISLLCDAGLARVGRKPLEVRT